MAKTNISFDNKIYSIDDSSLSSATTALRQQLSTTMNGTGATIGLGGTNYNIDSAKLSTATNAFVSHLGTISGNGHKVVVNGVEYSVDSAKVQGAISALHTAFGALQSGDNGGQGGTGREDYMPYYGELYSCTFTENGAILKSTGIFYEDGSACMDTYENGVSTGAIEFPAGTLTYVGSEIFLDGALVGAANPILHATISKDGTQITLVDNGMVYTLEQSNTDAPTEERLEGDGAEFYTFAPTALSFRSTAPLNELQEIQINGVTVDPSNYTLEEGSTIVTFPIDYLKTLDVGSYEVAVASDSKTVKGDFMVKAPELNEHGFYYNQPYTATIPSIVPVLGGYTVAFFVREDGTFDSIAVGANTETGTYEINGNEIIAVSPLIGQINCTISADGTAIYCSQLDTNFILGNNSIAADEDYIYTYKEDLGGYEVNCIDKTKAEYGAIKTGINGIDTVALAYSAFDTCKNITSIIIPNSVVSIDNYAFYRCVNLNNIIFEGTIEQWEAISIPDDVNWKTDVPATYVQCSDGQVAL